MFFLLYFVAFCSKLIYEQKATKETKDEESMQAILANDNQTGPSNVEAVERICSDLLA